MEKAIEPILVHGRAEIVLQDGMWGGALRFPNLHRDVGQWSLGMAKFRNFVHVNAKFW